MMFTKEAQLAIIGSVELFYDIYEKFKSKTGDSDEALKLASAFLGMLLPIPGKNEGDDMLD